MSDDNQVHDVEAQSADFEELSDTDLEAVAGGKRKAPENEYRRP